MKRLLIQVTGWAYIISVVYSRIYMGRHSLDQCLHGLAMGYLCHHFVHYYWRPHVFIYEIRDDSDHYKQMFMY